MQKPISTRYLFRSFLHSFSQVILLDNWKTGLFIFLGILTVSWQYAAVSGLGVVIAMGIGLLLTKDREFIESGLMGYNAVLTSIAILIFLDGPSIWLLALFGAGLSTMVTIALNRYFIHLPVLTLPFNITAWVILLFPYKLEAVKMSDQLLPQSLMNWQAAPDRSIDWMAAFFKSISEIFLLDSTTAGMLILLGIILAGKRASTSTVISIFVALITALLLGAEAEQIHLGMYGYNAVLAALAVCHTFNQIPSNFLFVYGLIGAALTVPITAAFSIMLAPYGLPALTIPFVITTWLMLLSSKSVIAEES
ncbi:urea transporter [Virgibacillus xinjiangensis]|uniref:Urea transporter n=1 Tax=Virgibacillus xinjiangensis TaxID=393090 RepID=A0ABV7CU43_9BACI